MRRAARSRRASSRRRRRTGSTGRRHRTRRRARARPRRARSLADAVTRERALAHDASLRVVGAVLRLRVATDLELALLLIARLLARHVGGAREVAARAVRVRRPALRSAADVARVA